MSRPAVRQLQARASVAWGDGTADLLVRGARVLLPSGEWLSRDIAVIGDRIAAVADGLSVDADVTLDVAGKVIVPTYVEPHAHAFGPQSLGPYLGQALTRGVGCVISDDSYCYGFVPSASYDRLLDTAATVPLVMRWSLRPDPPGRIVPLSVLETLLARDDVVQIGELMSRPQLDAPIDELAELLVAAQARGARIEGHSPGASARTLAVAATVGTTADHESISAGEVIERLRVGMWAFLRHNALRPDVESMVGELLKEPALPWERVAFTLDGTTPGWTVANGMLDAGISAALKAGLDPTEVYASATWRPATYARLDHELGVVGPGRLASFNVLSEPANPLPERVFSLGREVARNGQLLIDVPDVPWNELDLVPWSRRSRGPERDIYSLKDDDPVVHVESQAMLRPGRGEVSGGPHACVVIDPGTEHYTRGRLFGFPSAMRAIVSTLTPERQLVTIGSDPNAMRACVDAVFGAGGGLAYFSDAGVRILPMPVGGVISRAPFAAIASFWNEFESHLDELGHRLPDPATTLLFIANNALPGVRFTQQGLLETRSGNLLRAAVPAPFPA